MELLGKLDIVEILKIGAIGLGFLLALLSFLLIKEEQKKKKPSKVIINATRTFMFFSIVILILGILSGFAKSDQTLSLKLGDNVLTINEISFQKVSDLNIDEYYINSEFGFAFKKPNDNWSSIQIEKGISGIYRLMGIKSEYITEKSLEAALENDPIGKLFADSHHYYFINPESKTNISITDSTGNDIIEAYLSQLSQSLLDTSNFYALDTTDNEDKVYFLEEMADYRKQLLGFDTLEVKEAFLLSVYPKESLPTYNKNMKLPAFFTSLSTAFGTNTDKLIANEKQILAGMEIQINNVIRGNEIVDFDNKKWILFTENEKYFFTVEISYPPKFSSSINRWDELQDILNSFTLLK